MLNEATLLAKAERVAGEPVLVHSEARRSRPGEILSQRGLLAATRSALVFVEDELLRAGDATVFRTSDIKGHRSKIESFSAKLSIETSDGHIEFSDLQRELLPDFLKRCGLDQTAEDIEVSVPLEPAAKDIALAPFTTDWASTSAASKSALSEPPSPISEAPISLDGIRFQAAPQFVEGPNKKEPDDEDDETDEEDEDSDGEDDSGEDDEDTDEDADDDVTEQPQITTDPRPVEQKSPNAAPSSTTSNDPVEAKPAAPSAVSSGIDVWMVVVLLAALGGGWWFFEQLSGRYFETSVQSVVSLMKDWRDVLKTGFTCAICVVVFSAPSVVVGGRLPVFWSTLPAFLLLCGGLFGMQAVLPDPKQLGDTIPTAADLLERIRLANIAPLVSVGLLLYLFGLPNAAMWIRALSVSPRHRNEPFLRTEVQPGKLGTPIAMCVAAVGSALFGCLYFHSERHLAQVVGLSLLMVFPTVILVWQSSKLDPSVKWRIGGSPAAYAIQGALIFFTYWVAMRQLAIIGAVAGVEDALYRKENIAGLLDGLQSVLVSVDERLFSALVVAQLGVIAAVQIGHDAIVEIDPEQKRTFLGWALALALTLMLVAMLNGLRTELPNQYASLFALLHNLVIGRTPG